MCHCGEVDKGSIYPRSDAIDLQGISEPGYFQPFTWEGCVVKVADTIAFLGRDIEDADRLNILPWPKLLLKSRKLVPYLEENGEHVTIRKINNTALIHCLIMDLRNSSSPKLGIRFSKKRLELIKGLRELSRELIYEHHRLNQYKKFAKLVLESIFEELSSCYAGRDSLNKLEVHLNPYGLLKETFPRWITQYTDINQHERALKGYENKVVYKMENEKDYYRAIIGYISGMTDNFALAVFDDLTRFR